MSTITLLLTMFLGALPTAPTETNKSWKNLKQLAVYIGFLIVALILLILILAILLSILFLLGYLLMVFGEAILGATEPCVRVQSIEVVDRLNISYAKIPSTKSPSSVVTGSWNVSLGLCNIGHVKITYYDRMDVILYYKEAALGKSAIRVNNLEQSKSETWKYVHTKIDAGGERTDDLLAYMLARDINEGNATYGVKVDYSAVLKPNWWFSKNSTFSDRIYDTSFDNERCYVGFSF